MHRWQGRERFVILATAFGAGDAFLDAWQAWRDDPQRCERLVYIAIEPEPPTRDALGAAQDAASPLVEALRAAWPPLTPNLHRLSFDHGAVELLLAIGGLRAWLPELVATVDAFDLATLPSDSDARLAKAFARLAAPDAMLVAIGHPPAWGAALSAAGFNVDIEQQAGRGAIHARFAPAFRPRRAPARMPAQRAEGERHAVIVGAGLAGCAAAWALAAQGWRSTLLDRHDAPATEASGNPAGLFHGIVNAQDGLHARFNRAAALAARGAVQAAVDAGVPGSARGLLRLETTLTVMQMRAVLHRLALPCAYVEALGADEAGARAGLALDHPAWFYPGGGWVQPAGLARHFVARAGDRAAWRAHAEVQRLERIGSGWRLLDASDNTLAEAATVVLANAADALRLIGAADWPIDSVRGQISVADASRLATPRVPIAGRGYLLPAIGGEAMFGATAQPGDADPAVREADHVANLAQLARLTGQPVELTPADLRGRTGWRCSARDKLPLIGAVPELAPQGARLEQPRQVPRQPGLFLFAALGSRGVTWSALGAQVLASWVTGAPAPVEASLLDALDPARFVSRRARRGPNRPPSSRE
ncbi:FAD-dependent 5-carboxymethylaminomethyl-2-thiouridine(34) oxidoreductase MnmC [Rhizobacter sp. Root404]|uniref:FAD-dependent 5-carboxymethylaminomethyl-2-thiouridine(34) oxidoreductase MnmC n=1 Tax=Rhizobacter sp. Root404 TaxID=1736528 RepID=UPI000AE5AC40|nr:FAD-dependent 5-carboxymethylaminomethyl-2-thiouridine(34) oxidoreductase MnmC [Rhizobacter sp. Root404]